MRGIRIVSLYWCHMQLLRFQNKAARYYQDGGWGGGGGGQSGAQVSFWGVGVEAKKGVDLRLPAKEESETWRCRPALSDSQRESLLEARSRMQRRWQSCRAQLKSALVI